MKLILAAVLIYCSQSALGEDSELTSSALREITSVSEALPDQEDLDRAPRCEGNPRIYNTCYKFETLDGCLEDGADQGCFWAYY